MQGTQEKQNQAGGSSEPSRTSCDGVKDGPTPKDDGRNAEQLQGCGFSVESVNNERFTLIEREDNNFICSNNADLTKINIKPVPNVRDFDPTVSNCLRPQAHREIEFKAQAPLVELTARSPLCTQGPDEVEERENDDETNRGKIDWHL